MNCELLHGALALLIGEETDLLIAEVSNRGGGNSVGELRPSRFVS